MFVSDYTFLRGSTHSPQHPHLIHLQYMFLLFVVGHVSSPKRLHQCWPYHCTQSYQPHNNDDENTSHVAMLSDDVHYSDKHYGCAASLVINGTRRL